MARLTTTDVFREAFDIDSDIKDGRIKPHIAAASRRLRSWVGDTNYDAAIAATGESDLKDDLINAECHLTMHFAVLGFNSPLSIKGVVATSMSAEGKEMRKYLSPNETLDLSEQFLEMAREIAEPYIGQTVDTGIEISPVDDESDGEAVTEDDE